MSIAGRRAGLDGSRSNLFYEAIRIIKEMRDKTNGKYPRYAVWENVTGALSSNSGEDFKSVIENFCQIKDSKISVPRPAKWQNAGVVIGDGFSLGYRVVDSRYFGVAQRRRRIYIVCDFAGNGGLSLFTECGRLPWNTSKSFKAWKSIACPAEKGSGATSGTNVENIVLCDQGGERMDIHENIISTLRAQAHHPPIVMESAGFCTEHSANARSIGYEEEISPTLRAGTVPAAVFENHSADTRYTGPLDIAPTISATYGKGGNNQPFVVESKAFAICSKESNSMKSDNPESGFYETDTARTIDTSNQSPIKNQGGIAIVENIKNYDVRITSEGTKNARQNVYETETARTIDTGKNSPDSNQGGVAVVALQGSMIGRKDENGPQGSGVKENVSFSLTASDKHCVAYGIDRAAFNQGQNALYNFAVEIKTTATRNIENSKSRTQCAIAILRKQPH